jgi:outer membrane protein OmpA-like peptidoglycan-associated protein
MSLRESFGRYWLPLALTLLLLSTTVVFAQDDVPPKVDIFGGYSWLDPGGRVGSFKLPSLAKGFGIASTYNFNKYVGLTGDVDAHYGDTVNLSTITIGPRLKFRQEHFQPFLEAMVGLHRLSVAGIGTDNRIGTVLGGGIDIPLTKRIGFRMLQADYVYGHHNFFPIITGTQNLTGARLRSGLLINLGNMGPPPAPLAASCSINPASVMTGEPVTLTTTASNIPKNHTVTYAYQTTGGKAEGKDTTATVDTTGLAPGSYTVTATVTDPKEKKGVPATCNASFTIQEPPKHPPTISCSANPTTVQSGQPATITSTGSSPDNRPLTYTFNATGGRLTPNGPNATLDTAGASAGAITVNCTVSDDRGLTANSSTSVNVEVPPPPPTPSKLNEIQFKDKKKPARVDNEAKAILDDVALRLQRDADAKAVVIGNSAPDEKNGASLAQQRAVNTKAYLTAEKGIDPGRIELRTGNAGTMTSEIWIVPTGATFDQAGAQTFDETKVKSKAGQQYPGQKAAPARRGAKKPAAKQ